MHGRRRAEQRSRPRVSRVYNAAMPATEILTSVITSIVGAALDAALTAPVPPASAAQMAPRPFTPDMKKGELAPPSPLSQELLINGEPLRRAPGLLIRNQTNMILLPNALTEPVMVRYQTDVSGAVWRLWLLSAAEIEAPDPLPRQ